MKKGRYILISILIVALLCVSSFSAFAHDDAYGSLEYWDSVLERSGIMTSDGTEIYFDGYYASFVDYYEDERLNGVLFLENETYKNVISSKINLDRDGFYYNFCIDMFIRYEMGPGSSYEFYFGINNMEFSSDFPSVRELWDYGRIYLYGYDSSSNEYYEIEFFQVMDFEADVTVANIDEKIPYSFSHIIFETDRAFDSLKIEFCSYVDTPNIRPGFAFFSPTVNFGTYCPPGLEEYFKTQSDSFDESNKSLEDMANAFNSFERPSSDNIFGMFDSVFGDEYNNAIAYYIFGMVLENTVIKHMLITVVFFGFLSYVFFGKKG